MRPFSVSTLGSKTSTVGATSATLSNTLVPGSMYALTVSVDTWIKQGNGAQTAAANTANNVLIPAASLVYLDGTAGDTVAVIQGAALGGFASISPLF